LSNIISGGGLPAIIAEIIKGFGGGAGASGPSGEKVEKVSDEVIEIDNDAEAT
jgi:hypothetical protein